MNKYLDLNTSRTNIKLIETGTQQQTLITKKYLEEPYMHIWFSHANVQTIFYNTFVI